MSIKVLIVIVAKMLWASYLASHSVSAAEVSEIYMLNQNHLEWSKRTYAGLKCYEFQYDETKPNQN